MYYEISTILAYLKANLQYLYPSEVKTFEELFNEYNFMIGDSHDTYADALHLATTVEQRINILSTSLAA